MTVINRVCRAMIFVGYAMTIGSLVYVGFHANVVLGIFASGLVTLFTGVILLELYKD